MLKRKLCLAALTALATTAATTVATPAHAVPSERVCVTDGLATFNPPLTPAIVTGTVVFAYDATCVVVDDTGATGTQQINSASIGYTYFGSCATAVLSGHAATGVLTGGVTGATVVFDPANPDEGLRARAFALVPLDQLGNPCNMRTALFFNAGPDVFGPIP